MARKPATENADAVEAGPTQADPTQPRPLDAAGRALDEHGLPFNGPARARRLAELNIADPALEGAAVPEAEGAVENGAVPPAAPSSPVQE